MLSGVDGLLSSVQSTIQVLRSFRWDRPEWALADLSRRLGRPKSTILKGLTTLQAAGFVERVPQTSRYRPALGTLTFGPSMIQHFDLVRIGMPIVRQLAVTTGHTVHLAVYDAGEIIWLVTMDARSGYSLYSRVGRRAPASVAAAGKAILAFLDPDSLVLDLQRNWRQSTSASPKTFSELLQALKETRRRGYAYQADQIDPGIAAVAVPVLDACDRPIASLSITGPKNSFRSRHVVEIAKMAQKSARLLSRRWQDPVGDPPPSPNRAAVSPWIRPHLPSRSDLILRSAANALTILTLFTPEQPFLSFSEIHSRLGLAKSMVSRMLVTLEQTGALDRDRYRRYRVGAGLLELGLVVDAYHPTLKRARQLVNRIQELLAEPAAVFWGSFSGALCLASDKALPYRPGHWVTFPDSDHERAISGPWLGDEYPGIVAMPAAGVHDAAHARYLIERAMTDFVSDSGTEDSRTARLQDMVSLNPDEATREEVL